MKVKNKIFIFALILSLILSVSAVVAADDVSFDQSESKKVSNKTSMVLSQEDANEMGSQENQITNEFKTQVSESGLIGISEDSALEYSVPDFQDIQDMVDGASEGDTIYLDGKYYTGNIEISISKNNLTIVGGFSLDDGIYATMDGLGQTGIFSINAKHVTIKGINFINAKSYTGGAIYWDGLHGVIDNCSFINNTAESSDGGGAIFWANPSLTQPNYGSVVNTIFVNNSAGYGGAIRWRGYNGVLENCTFVNNFANAHGGAVYWDRQGGILRNNCFVNNTAYSMGGSIYINYPSNIIDNSIFIDNSADYGGAIYWSGVNAVLHNCSFINNHARYGGAVYRDWKEGKMDECDFVNNSAIYGGALYLVGGNCKVNNSRFLNNSVEYDGVVYWKGEYGNMDDCCFVNNSADSVLVFWEGEYGNMDDCCFVNNSANEGVVWIGGNGRLTNSEFIKNIAVYDTIHWASPKGRMNGIKIMDSSNQFAVYIEDSIISNVTLYNNDGVGFYVTDGNELENINISDNFNSAIYIAGFDNILKDIQIKNNYGNIIEIKGENNNLSNFNISNSAGVVITLLNNFNNVSNIIISQHAGKGIRDYGNNNSLTNIMMTPSFNVITSVNDFNVDMTVLSSAEGQVYFTIDGVEYRQNITDGISCFKLVDLVPDNYSIEIYYVGFGFWDNFTSAVNFTVDKKTPNLQIYPTVNGFDVDVVVVSDGDGQVYFTIGGVEYRQNITGNMARFNLENILPDNYSTAVYFKGSKYWRDASGILNFTVVKKTSTLNVTHVVDGFNVDVTVKSSGEGYVYFTIDGVEYRQNLADGEAVFKLNNLDPGMYSTTVYFVGSEYWENATSILNFTISKQSTGINALNGVYSIVYGGQYAVSTLPNQKVTLSINGKTYSANTDSAGVARFTLTSAMLGSVGVKIVSLNLVSDRYTASSSVKITVNKEKTVFSAKKLYKFKKSKKTKKIKITLKDSKAKAVKKVKVTLKITGKKVKGKKTFTLKTNNKGVVTFNLKKTKFAKKGKYSATLQFKGDKYYNKVTKKVKIQIR